MSPVKAPDASAWQSCAPIATLEPVRRARRTSSPASPAGRPAGRPCADDAGGALRSILRELGSRGLEPVHLPVARDQRAALPCAWRSPVLKSPFSAVSKRAQCAPDAAPCCMLRLRAAIPMMRALAGPAVMPADSIPHSRTSMLRGIRKASSNWLGRIVMGVVLGLIAVSFAIWGIGDIFRGFGRSTVAKIGSTEITVDQFRQIYNDRLQQIGRQLGRPITPDQARAAAASTSSSPASSWRKRRSTSARASCGLNVSDAEIARQITADPNFKGPTGQFDRARFEQIIRNAGYHRAALHRRAEAADAAPRDRRNGQRRADAAEDARAGAQPLRERAARDRLRGARPRQGRRHRAADARGDLENTTRTTRREFRAPEYRNIVVMSLDAGRARASPTR